MDDLVKLARAAAIEVLSPRLLGYKDWQSDKRDSLKSRIARIKAHMGDDLPEVASALAALTAAQAREAADKARIAELEARINRTLQDHGRMLWRDDIEPHCPSFDLCGEYADLGLRCSPCANKQSEAAGVAVLNVGKSYSPEECRLNRRIANLERIMREAEWIVEHAGYPVVAEEMRRALR